MKHQMPTSWTLLPKALYFRALSRRKYLPHFCQRQNKWLRISRVTVIFYYLDPDTYEQVYSIKFAYDCGELDFHFYDL